MNGAYVDLARAVAWPLVAAVAILLLVPGGYLLRFVDKLSDNASKIARAITELREAGATLSADIKAFQATYEAMNRELSPALETFGSRLELVMERLRNVDRSTSEILVTLGKEEIASRSRDDNFPEGGDMEAATADASLLSAEDMYSGMIQRWDDLYYLIKAKIGASFDGRIVGRMAWRLAHRRRTTPLAPEAAELIASLHSQYKRFARLQSTKEDWLSPDVYESFVNGVSEAMAGLETIPDA